MPQAIYALTLGLQLALKTSPGEKEIRMILISIKNERNKKEQGLFHIPYPSSRFWCVVSNYCNNFSELSYQNSEAICGSYYTNIRL